MALRGEIARDVGSGHGTDGDAQLDETCQAPWRTPMPRKNLITIMISHDLYHSGEINRQRALIRGAQGWELPK